MSTIETVEKLAECVIESRAELWKISRETDADGYLKIDPGRIRDWENALAKRLQRCEASIEPLRKSQLITGDGQTTRAHLQLLKAHEMLRLLLKSWPMSLRALTAAKLKADLAYLCWRSIRRRYKLTSPSQVLADFRRIVREVSVERRKQGLVDLLEVRRIARDTASERAIELFTEVCLTIEDADRGAFEPNLHFRREWLDANLLTARLFGMRTAIRGFDVLFEGGMSLAESPPGRVILVRGPFGSAKSILSLSLAGEVARKGGTATLLPLDDTIDSLEGYLVAFEVSGDLEIKRIPSADGNGSEGTLRIIYDAKTKSSLDRAYTEVEKCFPDPKNPRLNLIVVDPVNALLKVPGHPAVAREQLGTLVEHARRRGANLLLVAEREEGAQRARVRDPRIWLDELPYMADIVIDLSTDRVHGYDQRFIRVSKSRFQRERRGLHPVSVASGRGLVIAPSSLGFLSEISGISGAGAQEQSEILGSPSQRVAPAHPQPDLDFGSPSFSRLLGGLKQGDSAVFRGPQGSLKTLLALLFLAVPRDQPRPEPGSKARRSLFLTDRSHRPLHAYYEAHGQIGQGRELIKLEHFRSGYVQPGRLLLDIYTHFARARDEGVVYDRVVFANAGRWDLNCPFIRDDASFGQALLELFQRENASVVFVCAERETERDSALQRLLVDRATALVDFERVEYRGAERVLCRVARTRSEPGSRDWYEATVHGGRPRLTPSLLRLEEGGEGRPPRVYEVESKLHLFRGVADDAARDKSAGDSDPHAAYLHAVKTRLESVLMTPVKTVELDGNILTEAAQLGELSVGSDLHILQIDEPQLPVLKRNAMLHAFRRSLLHGVATDQHGAFHSTRDRWSELEKDAQDMILHDDAGLADDPYVIAIPYYRNPGFLCARADSPEHTARQACVDWTSLRHAVEREALVFEVTRATEETYNCLFLEIVLGLGGGEFPNASAGLNGLLAWIEGEFRVALETFHVLCSSVDKAGERRDKPVVSREWYTNLSRVPQKGQSCVILPLPRGRSVSGEWYLGVGARSAVPDIGLRIILDELTSREAEYKRRRQGLGIPFTRKFYEDSDPESVFPAHLEVDKDLRLSDIVKSARRRSQIYRYNLFAHVLENHLRELRMTKRPKFDRILARLLQDTDAVVAN